MRAVLIDGLNAAYRFHHANKHLHASTGAPTGVIYGVLSLVISLHKKYPDASLIFFWEGGLGKKKVSSWRRNLTGGHAYKANRKTTDDTGIVLAQVRKLQGILGALKYPQFYVPGLEADDLIGVVSKALTAHCEKVFVLSNDRDFFQLISKQVLVLRKEGDKMSQVNAKKVFTEFGVTPKQWVAFRSLTGDASDQIAGMPGCGPKTAPKYIKAGIQPRLERFKDHSIPIKAFLGPRVKQHWSAIHNSYILSRIPRSHRFKYIPTEFKASLKAAATACVNCLQRRMTVNSADQALSELVRFCAEYDLSSILSDRRIFFKYIRIQENNDEGEIIEARKSKLKAKTVGRSD